MPAGGEDPTVLAKSRSACLSVCRAMPIFGANPENSWIVFGISNTDTELQINYIIQFD